MSQRGSKRERGGPVVSCGPGHIVGLCLGSGGGVCVSGSQGAGAGTAPSECQLTAHVHVSSEPVLFQESPGRAFLDKSLNHDYAHSVSAWRTSPNLVTSSTYL